MRTKISLVTLLTICAVAFVMQSCKKDEATLKVNFNGDTIAIAGGEVKFNIESNTDWTIELKDAEWLTLSATSGKGNKEITATAGENTSTTFLEAILTVKAGDKKEELKIKQLAEVVLLVKFTPKDIASSGGDAKFSVECNTDWTIEVEDGAWLTLSSDTGNGNMEITATANATESNDPREATITVKSGEKTESIKIKQLGLIVVLYKLTNGTAQELESAVATFTLIDKDGDGVNWTAVAFQDNNGNPTGDIGIVSWSWLSGSALTPENYMILPAQTLGTDGKITFRIYAPDKDYYAEKFKIIVSSAAITADNCRDAETIFETTMTTASRTDYSANIPATYNNKKVYLGICHYDSTDVFAMAIEDITVFHKGAASSQMQANNIKYTPTVYEYASRSMYKE